MPGAIGGDAIRIALGSKFLPQQKIVLVLSVFFDRLIGGLGLLSWVIMAFIFFLSINIDHYGTNVLFFSVGAVIVVSILSIFAIKYFSFRLHCFTSNRRWRKGNFIQRIIANIADSIMLYRNCPVQLALCYGLSLIAHASRLTVVYILAVAMGMGGVDVITYVLAGSVSFFANFIPITPGGIGIAEAAFTQIIGILKTNCCKKAYGTIILTIRAFDAAILLPSLLMRYDKLRSKMRWFPKI